MADRGSEGAAPPHEGRGGWWPALLVGGLLLVPFVGLLVWTLANRVWAVGDIGLIEVAVRDVGGAHTPLLGAFSRYQWHHPGPLLFYVLAGPYRLLGSDGSALHAGAVVANALAVAGSAWLLWRRGRLGGLLLGGLVVALLLRSVGTDFLVSPWNPPVTLLPMLLFVLAVWSVTCADRWMLLVVVAVGSFVVQAHVGTAGAVGAGVVTAAVAIAVGARRRGGWREARGPVLTSVGLGLLLWLPPVVDAARHDGGNMRSLLDFWTSSHDHLAGWSLGARIVVSQFAYDAPWITGHEHRNAFTTAVDPGWRIPIVAVALVAAVLVAQRRRDTATVRLGLLTMGLTLVAWVSVARIVDEPYDYLVRWTFLVGALSWLTIGWAVLGLLRAYAPASAVRWAGAAVAAATVAIVVAVTVTVPDTQPASAGDEHLFAALAPELLRAAPRLRGPILVESTPDLFSAGLAGSVMAGLVDAGVDARYPRAFEWQLGPSHVVDPDRAGTRMLVAFGDAAGPLRTDPRYRVLASYDGLTARERAELDRLRAPSDGIASQLAWERAHPRLARRAADLRRRAVQAVVVVARP